VQIFFSVRVVIIFFSAFIFFTNNVFAQNVNNNAIVQNPLDVVVQPSKTTILQSLLDSNFILNTKGTPTAIPVVLKKHNSVTFLFYGLVFLVLVFGITKTFFSRYFNTLFRVFLNTSLRQNQLTDQLEQAALPSLIFNFFFIFTGGLYIYFLAQYFYPSAKNNPATTILLSILVLASCYFTKYISLLFSGWVTGYKAEAKSYIFIIFLLNKIIGIFLLPIIVILAFASNDIIKYTIFISLIAVILVFLLRFFRSYSLLQSKLKVSGFHFFLYILGVEVLPLALIYKFVTLYLVTKP
jgi:Domain of unknown function (DUF4271)